MTVTRETGEGETVEDRSPEKTPNKPGLLERAGSRCARHPIVVLGLWLVVLVAAVLANHVGGGVYSDDFSLPGTGPAIGAALLKTNLPGAGGVAGQVVFHVTKGTLDTDKSAIESALGNLGHLHDVVAVTNPFTTPGAISANGRIALATVTFTEQPSAISRNELSVVDAALAPARHAGVAIAYGEALGTLAAPPAKDTSSELVGFGVALVVLLLAFGSVVGAGLPLFDALLAVVAGVSILGLVAAGFSFATVSPTLATMIGLGVGIDYTLFLTTRYRQEVMDGRDPVAAAGATLGTSGRSVLIAASTVTVALLGLYASGIVFIGKLGVAAAITVATAALSAMTLAPALLGLVGRRIDALHTRTPVAEQGGDADSWHRWARSIERHPWRYLVSGLALASILAIPLFSMQIGHIGAGANPASYSNRQAYDLLSSGFGPGENGPLTIVVRVPPKANASSLASTLDKALSGTPGVAKLAPLTASPDHALLVGTVVPSTGPQSMQTLALYHRLVDTTLPKSLAGSGASGYVTGDTAAQFAFRDLVVSRLWIIITFVLGVAFLLLLTSFRSLLLAIKAAILNLFSIGAAYGVIVAVFQWGWGDSFLGVHEKVPIESYVPMMMFAITFGLAMDYEVFLLSRVREAYLRLGDNAASVAEGLSETARVISSAALIMASVFLAFVLSSDVVVKMLGVGLAASVLVDATVIRLVVVPATMTLFGGANWWVPRWLDKILPHLDPEGRPATS
jgi:RND superfamily putative drug exporter